MSNDNLKTWDALRTPPATALKTIKGGRLSGKSDINPQWRWQRMTETFGPVGIGWKWEQVERWTHDSPVTGEVMAFVRVAVHVKNGQAWSEPVYGTGGSFLLEKESRGLHVNDEAYKMAETDALGNACKYLGLAADVFLGMMDGSKYARRGDGAPPPAAPQPDEQALKLIAAFAEVRVTEEMLSKYLGHSAREAQDFEIADLRDIYKLVKAGNTWEVVIAADPTGI